MSDIQAAIDFIQQFCSIYDQNFVTFHTSSLKDVIREVCLGPIRSRKIVALYFHNEDDPFSKLFCPNLSINSEIGKVLENTYYFLGWTVSNETYHENLKRTLEECVHFEPAKYMITEKRAALLLICPIEDSITIFSILHGTKVKLNDILTTLQETEKYFKNEIKNEEDLENIKGSIQIENCIGSKEFQQMMCNRLHDRTYDCFEHNEHQYLKEKIGFSKYGPPDSTNGYNKVQTKVIEDTYNKIREFNNKYAQWKDQIVISFIYNCLEPTAEEKLARANKYDDYNPNNDILPIPLYVIRKCQGSSNPCQMFLDNDNRLYTSWKDYLEDNKLHKCSMVVPEGGKYKIDEKTNKVLLEKHLSPSCGVGHAILKGTDIASTIAGLTSGGIVIAALIPSIVIAPVALTAATATGIGVGVYSVIRNAINIYDRRTHGESLSFVNSDARGAYINIVAGTLGFVGAGAATAVAELTAKGVDIGQGAQAAFNTLRLMNMSASGLSAVNSTFAFVNDWVNEQQKPSQLTIIQLKSSALFFENIISILNEEEIPHQLQNLLAHKEKPTNLKYNEKKIAYIRKLMNKNQIFDVLNRNSKLLQEQELSFALEDDTIKLNGVSIENNLFLPQEKAVNLSFPLKPLDLANSNTLDNVKTLFESLAEKYGNLFSTDSFKTISALIQNFSEPTQQKLLKLLEVVINKLLILLGTCFFRLIKNHFANISSDLCMVVFQFMIDFLNKKVCDNKIERGTQTDSNIHENLLADVVDGFVIGNFVDLHLLDQLIQYVLKLACESLYVYCESLERQKSREENTIQNPYKITCNVCGGYYFYRKNTT